MRIPCLFCRSARKKKDCGKTMVMPQSKLIKVKMNQLFARSGRIILFPDRKCN